MHKHFNASGCIHIFPTIASSSVGGLHGSCQSAILAYVILPAWLGPLPLLSRGGGGGGRGAHTSALHWIRSWASLNKWVSIEKRHMLWSRQRTYIQPIVLQKGVHTILYFAWVCHQRGSCILMYALVNIICHSLT